MFAKFSMSKDWEPNTLLYSSFINEMISSIFQTTFNKIFQIDRGSLTYVGFGFEITKLGNSLEYELFQNFIKEKLKKEKAILKRKNLTIDVDPSIAKSFKNSQMVLSYLLMCNSRFSGKGEVSSTSPKSIDKARVSKESIGSERRRRCLSHFRV